MPAIIPIEQASSYSKIPVDRLDATVSDSTSVGVFMSLIALEYSLFHSSFNEDRKSRNTLQ